MGDVLSGEDFQTFFSPKTYLTLLEFFSIDVLKPLHEFYTSYFKSTTGRVTVLDFGCGPTIHGMISLAQYSPEVVLADYSEKNRMDIHKWMKGDGDAFDWTPIIRHVVVELEGKEESEVEKRKQQLQRVVKSVVHCDITKDPVLSPEYVKEYDIVHCFVCLEGVSSNKEEYKENILKLEALIKPGGKLLLYTVNREEKPEPAAYSVGKHWFRNLRISEESVRSFLAEIGFSDIVTIRTVTNEASPLNHQTWKTFNLHIATKH